VSWITERANEGAEPVRAKPEELPEGVTYRETAVKHHGGYYVAGERTVLDVPGRKWPASRPEECEDDSMTGEWLNDHVQVCRGCGLETT
jgi:hypothetical protein